MKAPQMTVAQKSLKRALLIVAGSFALIILSVFLAEILSPSHLIRGPSKHSGLAATDPANPRWAPTKAGTHGGEKTEQHFNHFKDSIRKTRGVILSTLESDTQGVIKTGTVFRLRGVIEAKQTIPTMHWSFQLPHGVRLVTGKLQGTVANLRAGDSHEVTIEVSRDVVQNQRIRFASWKMEGGEAIGNGVSLKLQNEASFADSSDEADEATAKTGSNETSNSLNSSVAFDPKSAKNPNRKPGSSPRSREDFIKRALQ